MLKFIVYSYNVSNIILMILSGLYKLLPYYTIMLPSAIIFSIITVMSVYSIFKGL